MAKKAAVKKTVKKITAKALVAPAVPGSVGKDGSVVGQTYSGVIAHARKLATKPLKNPQNEKKINALIKKMTLAEKAGQLTQYSAGMPTGPGTGRDDYDSVVKNGEVGSLLNVMSGAKANHYQRIAMEQSRLKIPLLLGYDIIHGDRTTFPIPLAMASSFDPDLMQAACRQAAIESRIDGINWVFSPMVDIARDARWGRVVEGAGEEVLLGAALATASVRGYQQDDLARPDSVAACVKHIAAYGAPTAGREYNTVELSEVTLRQTYLPPYQAAVDAGAATGMCAFHTLSGVPCSGNRWLLTDVLRDAWGFDGMIVSDWGSVGEMRAHGVALDGQAAALLGITAGVDMDMESDLYGKLIPKLVKSGQLPLKVVDEAVRRVLRIKFALGLFENPYVDETLSSAPTTESRALTRSIAEQSMVLLKNDSVGANGPLLPLKTSTRIALIGPLADDQLSMNGTWAGGADKANAITLRTTLQEKSAGLGHFVYEKGCEIFTPGQDGFAAAKIAAEQADVVVMALGEHPDQTGEAGARTRLNLPGEQQKLLDLIVATGKPVVLVLFNGHPLAITWAAQHVPAILNAWHPGIEAGPAVYNILFGAVNPSGKLPVSFPRTEGQCPIFLGQMNTGRPVIHTDLTHMPTNNGERYISRYIDELNAPLYPYGWGLSYTTFSYAPVAADRAKIAAADIIAGKKMTVSVTVSNTGSRAGAEVVQLYMNNRGTSVAQPIRKLAGFQKVELAPGESKTVKFSLGFADLAFVNSKLKQVVEPSLFEFYAGGDSTTANKVEVKVV